MRLSRAQMREIVRATRPYTMVCEGGVEFTARTAISAVSRNVPGDMVECGTWRGGCGLAMLLAQREALGRVERKVHFLDSFQGLPPVDPRDGPAAAEWQAATAHNCVASWADLEDTLVDKFGFESTEFAIWPGWFEDTLPLLLDTDPTIAVLRLDGDWYSSTETCLRLLMPRVSDGATVIVDDYYAWDGCSRALHDYLSRTDSHYRIKSLVKNTGAYFMKQQERVKCESI